MFSTICFSYFVLTKYSQNIIISDPKNTICFCLFQNLIYIQCGPSMISQKESPWNLLGYFAMKSDIIDGPHCTLCTSFFMF